MNSSLARLVVLQSELPVETGKLFTEWCRLKGYKQPTCALDFMIDEATGFWKDAIHEFAKDVDDLVWSRVNLNA